MATEAIGEWVPGDQPSPSLHDIGTEVVEATLEAAEFLGLEPAYQPNPVVGQTRLNRDKPLPLSNGKMYAELFTMANGQEYQVLNGIPFEKRTDVATLWGTALGTSIYGHNMHVADTIMKLGSPVVMIGAEGGHPHLPTSFTGIRNLLHNLARISIRVSAHNAHEILDVNDLKDLYRPSKAIVVGESRFAGIALGITAEAPKFGRKVVYTDAIAPPFASPKPIEVRRDNIRENLGRLAEIAEQVGSLAVHSSHLGWRRLRHDWRTMSLNPLFYAHVIATIPTLVNGTAGKMAADIPRSAKIHTDHFTRDPWGKPDDWLQLFRQGKFKYVRSEVHIGDHGGILEPRIQNGRRDRMGDLIDELAIHQDKVSSIDWRRVHMAGRLALVKH